VVTTCHLHLSRAHSKLCVRSATYKITLVAWLVCAGVAFGQQIPNQEKARGLAEHAAQFVRNGNLEEAEVDLGHAVELDPQDEAYLSALGAVLGMEHKLPASSSCLIRALALNPADVAARCNLAFNQFRLRQFGLARVNLHLFLKARPNDPTGRLLLGMVDEELRKYAAGAKWLASVPNEVRMRPQSIVALARCYYETGQTNAARATLGNLQSPEGVFLGGQVATQAGDFSAAERMFASIRATYRDPSSVAFHLALAQFEAGQFQESETTLRQLIDEEESKSEIYNLLAKCYDRQNQTQGAVTAMDKAIQLEPSNEANYLDLGAILLEHHRNTAALLAGQRAIQIDPSSAGAYYLEGLAQQKLGALKDAVKSYARSVALDPSSRRALLSLALAETEDGQAAAAEASFEKGLKQYPHDAILDQEYGRMLMGLKSDPDSQSKADSLFRAAICLDRSLFEPYYELGNLDLRRGRLFQALAELQTAAQLKPKNSQVHYTLSNLYRKLGRREKAETELRIFENLQHPKQCPLPAVASK
jgi:tetratricopeptide (TPR) repeat protein